MFSLRTGQHYNPLKVFKYHAIYIDIITKIVFAFLSNYTMINVITANRTINFIVPFAVFLYSSGIGLACMRLYRIIYLLMINSGSSAAYKKKAHEEAHIESSLQDSFFWN